MRLFNIILCLCIVSALFSQPGKDGVGIITASNQTVNKYSPVSVSIAASSNTVEVANINLLSICPGDLIMVYQAQGASMDISNTNSYGNILGYNSAGLYEFKYVQSVTGNTITTQTTFTNSYNSSGRVQVVKVPQYTSLTINVGASIVPKLWKDTTISGQNYRFGGLVVIHSSNIVNNGTITASGCGFRGGVVKGNTPYSFGPTDITSTLSIKGAEKGEGIFGSQVDYDVNGGRYCKGAPANGGGGATSTNAGGGGGANGNCGNIWNGQGIMIVNANNPLTAWSLDPEYIANGNMLSNSSGGGRGGYSVGGANANPLINAPGNPSWIYDNRREMGGRGGRPLINFAETRIFFGGGGGAGDANNAAGTSGGNGGGVVFLVCTGGITGIGVIESIGNSVGNTIGCNCDGSGGGGGGGSIIIKTNAISTTQNVDVSGGKGGTQLQVVSPGSYYESEGPGGGGGGGFVAISSGAILPTISGGGNGITQTAALVLMTSNGATAGANGQVGSVTNNFIIFQPLSSSAITIGYNGPVCVGSSIILSTSNGASTYSWTGPAGFTSNQQNPTISNTSVLMSGTYSVIQTFNSGCQSMASASINVTVNALPVPVINCNTFVCTGNQLNLSGSGGLTYSWSGPSSFTSNIQNPVISNFSTLNAGVYTLTVTDNNGCSATVSSQSISVIQGPLVNISGDTTCIGQNINLSAVSQLGNSYSWTGPNSFVSNLQNPVLGIANPSLAGVYHLTVTNSQGCITSTSVTLVVNNNGNPPSIITNTVLCTNSVLNLFTGAAQSYTWNGPNGFVSTVQNPTLNVNSNSVAGIYSLTVIDMNSCISTNTVNIQINITPTISITSNASKGCIPLCITYTCSSIPTTGVTFNWNLGNGTNISSNTVAQTCYNIPGIYTITANASLNGCNNIITSTIQVFPSPTADFNFAPNKPIEMKDQVIFTDASYGTPIVSWNWYFMNTTQYTSTIQNPVFTYPDAGQYVIALVVKSDKGCTDTILKTIIIEKEFSIYVPNAFTPNDDGINDSFYAKGYGILKLEMDIFDRWGENIFHSNEVSVQWDGTYKGKIKCKEDIYVWKIKVWGCNEVVKELCGHVTLIK